MEVVGLIKSGVPLPGVWGISRGLKMHDKLNGSLGVHYFLIV